MPLPKLTDTFVDITSKRCSSDEHELPECDKTQPKFQPFGKRVRGVDTFVQRMRARLVAIGKLASVAFSPRYLLYTNVTISFCLSGFGDILEQQYEIMTGQIHVWDVSRTRRMALTGIPIGIICHNCYKMVDYLLPGRSIAVVAKKVLLDQVVCSPLTITTFFISMGIQEGKTLEAFIAEFKTKAWKLYLAEWVIWPPAQFFNFYALPSRFRVLYDNLISLGYDVYTSHVKYSVDNPEIDR